MDQESAIDVQSLERETPAALEETIRRPRAMSGPLVALTPDPFASDATAAEPEERAVLLAQRLGIFRTLLSWVSLFWSAIAGLALFAVGLWITQLVENAFFHSPVLGTIASALGALAGFTLLVLVGREVFAMGRQRHIATLHRDFAATSRTDDTQRARKLVTDLASLYAKRSETEGARAELLALCDEIVDGRNLIEIAERTLVAPLDKRAKTIVASAAKRVSMVTTFAPRAIFDVVFVTIQAVRLIRQVAELYGGRPGVFGFLKLTRSVGVHLAITSGMAAGDTLLQQLVGHGIAAKVSARLGESVLNGLLTARIGLSAMAVCRPMPFQTEKPPTLQRVVPFLFRSGAASKEPEQQA